MSARSASGACSTPAAILVSGSENAPPGSFASDGEPCSNACAASIASSQACASPRTTTSRSDGWVSASTDSSACCNCARLAGVAMTQEASMMPGRLRRAAPTCISATESLYRFAKTRNLISVVIRALIERTRREPCREAREQAGNQIGARRGTDGQRIVRQLRDLCNIGRRQYGAAQPMYVGGEMATRGEIQALGGHCRRAMPVRHDSVAEAGQKLG